MALVTLSDLEKIKETARLCVDLNDSKAEEIVSKFPKSPDELKLEEYCKTHGLERKDQGLNCLLRRVKENGGCTHIVVDANWNIRFYQLVPDDSRPFINVSKQKVGRISSSGPPVVPCYVFRSLGGSYQIYKNDQEHIVSIFVHHDYPSEFPVTRRELTDHEIQLLEEFINQDKLQKTLAKNLYQEFRF